MSLEGRLMLFWNPSSLISFPLLRIANDLTMINHIASLKSNCRRTTSHFDSTTLLGDGTWSQVFDSIEFDFVEDAKCGFDVGISNDGRTVIVSCPLATIDGKIGAGITHIFRLRDDQGTVGGSWVKLPTAVKGSNAGDDSGYSISFARDANIFAIGEPGFDNNRGRVRIFALSGINASNSSMSQIGVLTGDDENDRFGVAIDLSGDGKIILVGADQEGGGYAKRFVMTTMSPNSWDLSWNLSVLGGGSFGASVSLSRDGSKAAIGASEHDNGSGLVMFYDGITSSYRRGQQQNEKFGSSVSLSDDGTILGIGADGFYCGVDIISRALILNCGRVQIFNVESVTLDIAPKIGNDLVNNVTNDKCGRSIHLTKRSFDPSTGLGTLVVGCRHKVLVANLANSELIVRKTLTSNTSNDDFFGNSVAMSSTLQALIVGAPGNGEDAMGNAQVFGNPALGLKTPTAAPTIYTAPTIPTSGKGKGSNKVTSNSLKSPSKGGKGEGGGPSEGKSNKKKSTKDSNGKGSTKKRKRYI